MNDEKSVGRRGTIYRARTVVGRVIQMRVITGSAKGHKLKAPKGLSTRPMLDRVKEALFSVLEGYGPIRGRVLDLYAGTGSLGIECLSRGASWADFVEQRGHVCRIIAENLEHTRLDDRARVVQ